ncbi:MAG: hypothetical protein V3V08_00325 [Nannocystaceae bacterium]
MYVKQNPVILIGPGHSIPSGTSFTRELWIEVVVTDAAGNVFYTSGLPAANGDLPDLDLDPDLTLYSATLYDAAGDRTFFTWRAVDIDESHLHQAGEASEPQYKIHVPLSAVGPLTLDTRLRLRAMPPALLRELGLDDILPLAIHTIWEQSDTIAVVPIEGEEERASPTD